MAEEKKDKVEVPKEVEDLRKKLVAVLESEKVETLIAEENLTEKVVVLDSKTDPKKAIEILIQQKIRAAPVIDNDNNKFIGVLDLRDTVKFALESYKKQSSALTEKKQKAMEYLTSSPQITTQSLKYLSQMRKFRTVSTDDNLLNVANVLTQGSHIVGVIDKSKNTLCAIITQGQLFRRIKKKWLNNNNKSGDDQKDNALLTDKCDINLETLLKMGYITSPIKSIKSTVKAYEAFELMSKLDLSGLAVVDGTDGKLIHNTSATDIKLWLIATSTLEQTIEQFLIEIRQLSLETKFPIAFCELDQGLSKVVNKLGATGYHRLWICDKDRKPTGVIALTDIFRFVCKTKQ